MLRPLKTRRREQKRHQVRDLSLQPRARQRLSTRLLSVIAGGDAADADEEEEDDEEEEAGVDAAGCSDHERTSEWVGDGSALWRRRIVRMSAWDGKMPLRLTRSRGGSNSVSGRLSSDAFC